MILDLITKIAGKNKTVENLTGEISDLVDLP